ncbi:hypothetical protein [Stygiolobus caldivivus]|nr:hypothetical protein [Stygiolobus caldivivus]
MKENSLSKPSQYLRGLRSVPKAKCENFGSTSSGIQPLVRVKL